MRIDGAWERCIDGVIRPIVRAEIMSADGTPIVTPLLIDTGADRTVLIWDVLSELQLPLLSPTHALEGLGGEADSVDIQAEIRFNRREGGQVSFTIRCAAVTEAAALDMSLLGRDILNHFAVIVDQPGRSSASSISGTDIKSLRPESAARRW
jgi:predicted aspartyl protease